MINKSLALWLIIGIVVAIISSIFRHENLQEFLARCFFICLFNLIIFAICYYGFKLFH